MECQIFTKSKWSSSGMAMFCKMRIDFYWQAKVLQKESGPLMECQRWVVFEAKFCKRWMLCGYQSLAKCVINFRHL